VEEHQQAGPITAQLAGTLDEVFFRKTDTNTEYLLTDALGSTWGLADQSGNVNTEYKYDSFGSTQQTGQATNNPLQFTGRENDGTGLYYYRKRYYSPDLRRFISRDPLREAAGENEYSYVRNNPISLTDPLGLQDGPVNYLRDPFPSEYWIPNAAANTISDLLSLDAIAAAAWTLGNWCRPMSERLWAGGRLAGITALNAFGGAIIGRALGWVGKGLKRIPLGPNKAGPGVYNVTSTGGSYIGQSGNMGARIGNHFNPSGKLGKQGFGKVSEKYYPMPGSTRLQREVYEQYLIRQTGIDKLINIRNPMGGRMDQYFDMIDGVIRQFNLPR
jgi:RHS repeat-associated protein